jgi:hypothetical protein
MGNAREGDRGADFDGRAGGPLKPGVGLSGVVPLPDKASLPLARAFWPSTRTRSPLVLRTLLRRCMGRGTQGSFDSALLRFASQRSAQDDTVGRVRTEADSSPSASLRVGMTIENYLVCRMPA